MDAGNFPNYEQIINTTPLPRTRQGNGVFLLELSFSPTEQTHSLNVPMRLEFGRFGDVCKIDIEGWTARHSQEALPVLKEAIKQLQPPAEVATDEASASLTLTLMDNKPVRDARVFGTLVFNPEGLLTALLAPLK